ncbi:MAG: hypothetical protein M1401_14895 [Chloroflexi bacterium]|nr:hypothetical protein [Chloroflexota bacterium]MCL5110117.1 hypothetical protein [Chloroflexota bacterium]
MRQERVNTNVKGLALALVLFVAIIAYAVPALTTGNAFWFWPAVGVNPSQIVTYRDGVSIVHRPGTPGYKLLAPLISKALTQVSGLDDSGFSDNTLREIRAKGRAVEVYYSEAITIPTSFRTIQPNQILIPLDDKYEQWAVAYTGNDGKYWAQGLRIRPAYDEIKAAFFTIEPASK